MHWDDYGLTNAKRDQHSTDRHRSIRQAKLTSGHTTNPSAFLRAVHVTSERRVDHVPHGQEFNPQQGSLFGPLMRERFTRCRAHELGYSLKVRAQYPYTLHSGGLTRPAAAYCSEHQLRLARKCHRHGHGHGEIFQQKFSLIVVG